VKITKTITIDGKTAEEYEQIKAHLESLKEQFPGWTITYDPLLKRATAIRSDEVTSL
jgi:hypothetical protein